MIKEKMIKELSIIMVLVLVSMTFFSGGKVYAAADDQVSYTVTYGQTEARGMLASLNSWRTGSDAWYWNRDNATKTTLIDAQPLQYDAALEQVAMQRAVELAALFSHTRPDGTSCFEAYGDLSYGAIGENIAVGQRSAESVLTSWKEENEDYSGQGHRRNMLNTEFHYIGIGHVVCNGVHYWVQEFNDRAGAETDSGANDMTKKVSVDVDSSLMRGQVIFADRPYGKFYVGDTADLSKSYVGIYNGFTITPIDQELTWESSDTEIAEVDDTGLVTGIGAGSVTITASASLFGTTLSDKLTLTVAKKSQSPGGVTVPSASPSASVRPSAYPSASPSASVRPSAYPSASPSASVRPSAYPSASPSASVRPSAYPSASPSASVRPSAYPSASPSPGTADEGGGDSDYYDDYDNGSDTGDNSDFYDDNGESDEDYDNSGYDDEDSDEDDLELGSEVEEDGLIYKIAKGKTLVLVDYSKIKVTVLDLPQTVEFEGTKYKLAQIGTGALAGSKILQKVVVGKNVTKIGKRAFENCKKLKTLVIKSDKLTKSGVKKALAGSGIRNVKLRGSAADKLPAYKRYFAKSNSGAKVKVSK